MRLIVGLLASRNLLVYGLDLRESEFRVGWADPQAVRIVQGAVKPYAWSFWFLVPDGLLWPTWVLCVLAAFMFAVGLFSRTTAVITWVVLASHQFAPRAVAVFGFDQALTTWTLYLAVTGRAARPFRWTASSRLDFGAAELVAPAAGWAGSARVRRSRADDFREHRVAPDPASYLPGLRHGGTGEAARRGVVGRIGDVGALASAEFGLINFTWTATHPWFLNVLTHGSLALEVGYPALVWVRPLRPLILGLTVALHLGIALVAPGLTEFGLAMIAGNLAFASGPRLNSRDGRRPRAQPARFFTTRMPAHVGPRWRSSPPPILTACWSRSTSRRSISNRFIRHSRAMLA